MTVFLWNDRLTLGQIISGTKCDRDKQIFSAESGGQYDRVGHKKESMGLENVKNGGQ